MLRKIEVGHGWHRYRAPETRIKPGEYYRCDIRRPDERTKKMLGLVAAQSPNGDFVWLCPFARWVKSVVSGLLVPETATYGLPEDPRMWDALNFDPAQLRPYQRRFVVDAWNCTARGHAYRRGAVVGLGGGKTLMALTVAQLGERPAILAPRHVHPTIETQAKLWGLSCPAISTYESAHRLGFQPDVLLCDEAHMLKDPQAARSERVRKISEGADIVCGFTGSPTAGRAGLDIRWLDCISPGSVPLAETSIRFLFSDETELKEVAPGRKAYVTPKDSWDLDKLTKFIAPYIFRVDTAELLAHLPPIEYRVLTVPQTRDYDLVRMGGATEGTRSKRVTQCRMASSGFVMNDSGEVIRLDSSKANTIKDLVDGLDEPVVIYSAWRESIIHLARTLTDYRPAVISGDTADIAYEQNRFIGGDTNTIIINTRMGSGIDGLQSRSRVAIFESWSLNPDDRRQSIARVFRSGQDRGVVVIDVVSDSTLDARTLELIGDHNQFTQSVIEGLLAQELDA